MTVERRDGSRRRRIAVCVLGIALVVAFAVAGGAATTSTASAAGGGREKLPGHQGLVPPGATLVGPAPASTSLPLTVTLKPRDPAALAAEVQAVSERGSPDYRHFLTPAEFSQRYGPTPASIAEVTSSLRRQGLTVGPPSATGLSLPVSGTVAQVQTAFSTPISKYRLSSGKTGYDNDTAPEVDDSVAPADRGHPRVRHPEPPATASSLSEASQAVAHPAGSTCADSRSPPGSPRRPGAAAAASIAARRTGIGALDAPDWLRLTLRLALLVG